MSRSLRPLVARIDRFDRRLSTLLGRLGPPLLRVAMAAVFIAFGILKPLGYSPAAELVMATGEAMAPLMPVAVAPMTMLHLVGWWEVLIGVCLLWRPLIRLAIPLLMLQMVGTFMPLVLLPQLCFQPESLAPTLEGQYILKNLVIIAAALVIGGTVRAHGRPRSKPGDETESASANTSGRRS